MRKIVHRAAAGIAAGFGLALSTARGLYEFVRRPWAWRTIAALGFTLTVLLIHRRIYQYLLDDDQYQIDLHSLQVVQRPEWAAEGLDCVPMTAPNGRMSLLDENLAPTVADYYARCPWVAKVRVVEKLYPNRIRVTVDLRRPVAAVAMADGIALVDAEGVRVPGVYPRVPPKLGALPVIYGAEGKPAPPGAMWLDRAVAQGLSVVRSLAEYRLGDTCPIAVIDVRNAGGRQEPRRAEIVLWSPGRIPIHWGRPPDTTRFGEVSVAQKMENLRRVLARYPALAGLKSVKLQFHSPYVEVAVASAPRTSHAPVR